MASGSERYREDRALAGEGATIRGVRHADRGNGVARTGPSNSRIGAGDDGEMKADAATNGRFRPIEGVSPASWDARFSPLAPDGAMAPAGPTPRSLLLGR
jgi:hypothetical protein